MVTTASGSSSECLKARNALGRSSLIMRFAVMMGLAWLAWGCQAPDESVVPEAGSPGVTAQEVLLGSSLALKGHASFLGTQTFRVAMSYLNH